MSFKWVLRAVDVASRLVLYSPKSQYKYDGTAEEENKY